ncbi:MAG: type II toxin-antitoxin system MqsR family toxin [Deltaproteobacteria bacterium]|nr:type II toxin-antitoxin system MqsR family toxin [Deltaproteobacteria bacterium]
MPSKKPFYDLNIVKEVAQKRDGLLLSRTKAAASFATYTTALVEARRMIDALRVQDFVETKEQRDRCDVYAVRYRNQGWYVKFTLSPDQVLLISFHVLESKIRKASGHWIEP